jgi:hypothetical protein
VSSGNDTEQIYTKRGVSRIFAATLQIETFLPRIYLFVSCFPIPTSNLRIIHNIDLVHFGSNHWFILVQMR